GGGRGAPRTERVFRVPTDPREPRQRGHPAVPPGPARRPVPTRDRGATPALASVGARFPLYGGRARRHAGARDLELGLELQAGARGGGRCGAGHRLRHDPAKARSPARCRQHPLQSAVARPDRATQPGHREGERGAAPAGAAHPGAAAQTRRCGAPVSRATAGVVLLVLAARAAPAQGITVTVGPQLALASYREVASGLRYQGTGFGGGASARYRKLSAEAGVVRLTLDPAAGGTATRGGSAATAAWRGGCTARRVTRSSASIGRRTPVGPGRSTRRFRGRWREWDWRWGSRRVHGVGRPISQ